MLIAPSILAADFAHLGRDVDAVRAAGVDMLHVDVMDAHFVPNLSIGVPVVASLKKATDLPLDVHLMITDPCDYVEPFAKAGATGITVHLEANDPGAALDRIAALGLRPGLSVKPGTPVEAVFPYLDRLWLVLVMSVEPGFGGQSFMPGAVGRIAALRAEIDRRGLPCRIQVDGGIGPATAGAVLAAGADILVAGTAVFAGDVAENVRKLRALSR